MSAPTDYAAPFQDDTSGLVDRWLDGEDLESLEEPDLTAWLSEQDLEQETEEDEPREYPGPDTY